MYVYKIYKHNNNIYKNVIAKLSTQSFAHRILRTEFRAQFCAQNSPHIIYLLVMPPGGPPRGGSPARDFGGPGTPKITSRRSPGPDFRGGLGTGKSLKSPILALFAKMCKNPENCQNPGFSPKTPKMAIFPKIRDFRPRANFGEISQKYFLENVSCMHKIFLCIRL